MFLVHTRDAGGSRVVNQFIKKSADESQSAAKAAVIASLRSGIASAAKGSTSG